MTRPADITFNGCHDSTYLYDVELTAAELALLGRIADLTVTAGGVCKPTMRVEWAPAAVPAGESCVNCYMPITDGIRKRDEYGSWIHDQCPAGAES